uniref:Uncharacterized protein n=1 Tax=Arundo donax TaxID=35708 RepID=A0A0A9A623_ARUDO
MSSKKIMKLVGIDRY